MRKISMNQLAVNNRAHAFLIKKMSPQRLAFMAESNDMLKKIDQIAESDKNEPTLAFRSS